MKLCILYCRCTSCGHQMSAMTTAALDAAVDDHRQYMAAKRAAGGD